MKTKRLASFANAFEAHLLKGRLENEGIAAVIHNESNLYGGMAAIGCAGVDVFVYEDEYERAKTVMETPDEPSEKDLPRWTVTEATEEDAATIADFQLMMAKESEGTELEKETVLKGVKAVLEDSSKGFYLVARDSEGQAIGSMLSTKEWSDWRATWYWWIQSVFVDPAYRRQGVYSAIYATIKEMAQREGVATLRLYVDRDNETAKRTYQKNGMEESHYLLYEEDL